MSVCVVLHSVNVMGFECEHTVWVYAADVCWGQYMRTLHEWETLGWSLE